MSASEREAANDNGEERGPIGHTLANRYTIRRMLGRGGVGVVYLATDTQKDIDVVVKVLGSQWVSDEDAVARFEREAQRLRSLRHPNIVEMYDYGHEDGRAFLVMQLIRGCSLAEFIREREYLSLDEFVPIAAQILKGVGYAHSREIMIRDIKPSNIMLCERKGRANFVMILDFGLAKRVHNEMPITREHVMGTAGYIAPEALTQEGGGLGVDVYALGVLFWYLLTGRLPYEAENDAAVFYKTVHDPVPSLHDTLPSDSAIPNKLIALVHECLAKSPEDRPADSNAVIERLIDAVPARLFRLPRTSGKHPRLRPGEGNSGMIALTGANPSDQHSVILSASHSASTLHLDGPSSAPSLQSVAGTRTGEEAAEPEGAPPGDSALMVAPPPSRRAWPLAVLAVGAIVALAIVGPQLWANPPPSTTTAPSTKASQSVVPVSTSRPTAAEANAQPTRGPGQTAGAAAIPELSPAPESDRMHPDDPIEQSPDDSPRDATQPIAVTPRDAGQTKRRRTGRRRSVEDTTPTSPPAAAQPAPSVEAAPEPEPRDEASLEPAPPPSAKTDDSVFLHEQPTKTKAGEGLMHAD